MGFFQNLFGASTGQGSVKEMIDKGAVIIDVRTPGEFQGGHVKGSKNFPLQSIDSKINEIKKMNKPVVVCCASGMRSGQAAGILRAEGVEVVNGGSWLSVNGLVA